ncbi:TetR/AcrR family transcriptional regulator [Aminobacter aganoensis]|uniref:AcrR family transcriptional regulator n=1 Tax=Aminobacter aganoensis TaxID=83264 RepID=A0A7X0F569_9HYPH|nr:MULTISPECIES: TetR family transcriptional regulator [Aminobacter]KQU65641.1 TetR family transcriptional regulator [Aminobacter sp. DSM 101952]MBB6353321.1 AcrR family transcriptional regulator [Aminobacter aganoensis]
MPRPKTLSDHDVLVAASRLLHDNGPDALTFESLGRACGLSPATLVQRFKSKARLKQATLLHAWDGLDARTAALAASTPRTPEGAIELLVGLSDYGGIETYAEGLLVLREDLRDPVLRARGATWKVALSAALDERFTDVATAPRGIGLLMASQWQGSLLWWGFDPQGKVQDFVAAGLRGFVSAVLAEPAKAG